MDNKIFCTEWQQAFKRGCRKLHNEELHSDKLKFHRIYLNSEIPFRLYNYNFVH
jgi:hypothetical protein